MIGRKLLVVAGILAAFVVADVPAATAAAIHPVKGPVAVGGGAVHKAHKKPHRRRRRHHRKVVAKKAAKQ